MHDIIFRQLDWCFPQQSGRRTPQRYHYSHDAYFLWRDFKVGKGVTPAVIWSDRMRRNSPEKYENAVKSALSGRFDHYHMSKKDAKAFVKEFFGEGVECVGYGVGCNVSNGYPIGIFFIKEKTDV